MRHAIVLLLLMLVIIAYANDTHVIGMGGRMRVMDEEHPSIRMVREWVRIDVYPRYYDVQAQFIFHNTGPATTVRMGFPEDGGGDIGSMVQRSGFQRFFTTVDGHAVLAQRTLIYGGAGGGYLACWVKTVPFASGQTRTVRVFYRSRPGEDATSNRFVIYNFTGGNWQGSVDESSLVAVMHLTGSISVEPALPCKTQLTSNRHAGNQFAYVWRNWQADKDFMIYYLTTVPGWMTIRNLSKGTGLYYEPPIEPLNTSDGYAIDIYTIGTPEIPNPIQWMPMVFQHDGTTFISLMALQSYLKQLASEAEKKNQVTTRWHTETAEAVLQAGGYTFCFQRGQRTMLVGERRVPLPAASIVLTDMYWRPKMYVPLMPVLRELHGTATPDPKAHNITLQIPAFW